MSVSSDSTLSYKEPMQNSMVREMNKKTAWKEFLYRSSRQKMLHMNVLIAKRQGIVPVISN